MKLFKRTGDFLHTIRYFIWFFLPVVSVSQTTDAIILEARALMLHHPDSADSILKIAYASAQQHRNYTQLVPLAHQLAIVALMKGNTEECHKLNKTALHYANLAADDLLIANSLTKVAKDYRKQGFPDSAMNSCLQAINLYKNSTTESTSWACYTILGDIAFDAGRFDDTEENYLKAWDAVKNSGNQKDMFIVAGILQHYLITSGQQDKYAVIIEDLLKRHPYYIDELTQKNAHYHSLLRLYEGNDESIEELKSTLALHRRFNQPVSILACMTRMGKLFTKAGDYDEGYDTLKQALLLAGHSMPSRLNINYMLFENRQKAGKPDAAIDYLKNYYAIRDSINTEKALIHIRDLEVAYKTNEKELALLKEKSLSQLNARQRNIAAGSAMMILLVGVCAGWIFWNRAAVRQRVLLKDQEINLQKIKQLEQEKKLLALSSMIEGQEGERKRIAQDLHDGLGSLLASVKAQFTLIRHQVDLPDSSDVYKRADSLIDHASAELRRIAYNMMPSTLARLGLRAAIEDMAASLGKDHGIKVDLQILGLNSRLGETREIMVYRIIQELITNVIKHAQATYLLIQINQTPSEIFIVVEDNGIGIEPKQSAQRGGIGMESIESRVKYLNGTMDVSIHQGKGMCVTVHFPV